MSGDVLHDWPRPRALTVAWFYYDRSDRSDAVLCQTCATARWGDPEAPGNEAFEARYHDQSGDWCTSPFFPRYQVCTECAQ